MNNSTSGLDAFIACQMLLYRFSHSLDSHDPEGVASLFTETGIWYRQGEALKGRARIIRALQARDSSVVTRHLVTNIVVEPVDRQTVSSRCTVLTYKAQKGTNRESSELGFPVSVLDYHDILTFSGDKWLLQERKGQRIFA